VRSRRETGDGTAVEASFGGVDPTARFVELVRGPESGLALDEAALLIAARARHPAALDLPGELGRLDDLADRVRPASLERLLEVLFVEEGFSGDRQTYDDPRNSFLPDVLDRRLGIPISLSVLTLEVGRRAGIALAGVGMPGHFLLRLPDGPVFIDAFAGGLLLDEAGCAERFRATAGSNAHWDTGWLAPVGPRAILARMLANLRRYYVDAADAATLAWIVTFRGAIPGVAPGEAEAVADDLARRGRFAEAAELLEATGAGEQSLPFRARLN
jgi:hypothetical protein